jgi:outer membrane protein OmpA-like peptidoglycan-associated protein
VRRVEPFDVTARTCELMHWVVEQRRLAALPMGGRPNGCEGTQIMTWCGKRLPARSWAWPKNCVIALSMVMTMMIGSASADPQQFIIFFGTNEYSLTPEAREVVSSIAAASHERRAARIAVAGYGDGNTAHDAVLGDQRAAAVERALVDAGVEAGSIVRSPPVLPGDATGIPVHKVTVTLRPR